MKSLLFDHNLSPKLLHRLADLYPGSGHVFLVGLDTADDRTVWEYARHHDYIIVTKDADYSELLLLYGFPPDVAKQAARKLEYIDLAIRLEDLRVPPGNRLHALEGDRKGQHAISVNDQWRICFRFVDGDAYDVEVCDYH